MKCTEFCRARRTDTRELDERRSRCASVRGSNEPNEPSELRDPRNPDKWSTLSLYQPPSRARARATLTYLAVRVIPHVSMQVVARIHPAHYFTACSYARACYMPNVKQRKTKLQRVCCCCCCCLLLLLFLVPAERNNDATPLNLFCRMILRGSSANPCEIYTYH